MCTAKKIGRRRSFHAERIVLRIWSIRRELRLMKFIMLMSRISWMLSTHGESWFAPLYLVVWLLILYNEPPSTVQLVYNSTPLESCQFFNLVVVERRYFCGILFILYLFVSSYTITQATIAYFDFPEDCLRSADEIFTEVVWAECPWRPESGWVEVEHSFLRWCCRHFLILS